MSQHSARSARALQHCGNPVMEMLHMRCHLAMLTLFLKESTLLRATLLSGEYDSVSSYAFMAYTAGFLSVTLHLWRQACCCIAA